MTTGKSLVAGIMGWPVSHSRSPKLHGYWLGQHQIDGVYIPLPVRPDACAQALQALPVLGFRGVSLTIPHKEIALQVVTDVDPLARRVGAVNTVLVQTSGQLFGMNTDVYGFAENLRQHAAPVRDKTVAVYGAGGAARAVIVALQEMGAKEIILCNRTPERAALLAREFGLSVRPWEQRHALLGVAQAVVNTTSQGMSGQAALDVSLDALPRGSWVCDIVYTPLETPLLRAARQAGHQAIDGLGMLLHQGRPAFQAWFGVMPDVTAELRALLAEGL